MVSVHSDHAATSGHQRRHAVSAVEVTPTVSAGERGSLYVVHPDGCGVAKIPLATRGFRRALAPTGGRTAGRSSLDCPLGPSQVPSGMASTPPTQMAATSNGSRTPRLSIGMGTGGRTPWPPRSAHSDPPSTDRTAMHVGAALPGGGESAGDARRAAKPSPRREEYRSTSRPTTRPSRCRRHCHTAGEKTGREGEEARGLTSDRLSSYTTLRDSTRSNLLFASAGADMAVGRCSLSRFRRNHPPAGRHHVPMSRRAGAASQKTRSRPATCQIRLRRSNVCRSPRSSRAPSIAPSGWAKPRKLLRVSRITRLNTP
jgi:hypothetical protein